MSNCPFCNLGSSPSATSEKRSRGLIHRAWRKIQWAFPIVMMVVMPKCPMCVAADVALLSGIGISVTAARWIQGVMILLCVVSLVYLGARYWRGRNQVRRLSAG